MMRFGLALDNHSGLTLSVDVACLSSDNHLSRADPSQDHSRALQSCILGPPRDWHRRVRRPRQSWLKKWRTIYGLSISAWRQQGGAHWIDRLRLPDMLLRERAQMVRLGE